MGSALTTVALPLALALVMLGLGLSLTVADFARVGPAAEGGRDRAGPSAARPAGCVFRAGPGLRPAAVARGGPDAPGRLARWHHREPVQPPVPGRRRAQHHADRGELADRGGDPAGHHQPGDLVLRPARGRHARAAARQDPAGLRRGARAGRDRDGRPAAGDRVRRPHGQARAHPVRGGARAGRRRDDRRRAGELPRLLRRRRTAGPDPLSDQPERRLPRAAGPRRRAAAGDRQCVRDRHPQRHPGDRGGDQRPGQCRARRPWRRLQRDHVPGGCAVRAGVHPDVRSTAPEEATAGT